MQWNRGWRKRLIFIALAFGLVWLVLALAAPPLIRQQLERRAGAALGEQVSVGAVSFNPLTLTATVDDLSLAEPGQTPWLTLKRLKVDLQLSSLLRLAPVISELTLTQPNLRLVRQRDGTLNISALLDRLAERPAEPDAKPARFALYNVSVQDGTVALDDQLAGQRHLIDAIALQLPFLSNLPADVDVTVQPRLAARINGAPVTSTAESVPFASTHHSRVRLKIDAMDLARYWPYAAKALPLNLRRALLDADWVIDFQQPRERPPVWSISGSSALREVGALDAAGQPLLDIGALRVVWADVQPLQKLVHVAKIELGDAKLRLQRRKDGQLAWPLAAEPAAAPGKSAAKPAAASATPPGPALQLRIDEAALRNLQIGWRDAAVSPPLETTVQRLDARIQAFSTAPGAKPATISLDAALADGAQLQLSGAASPEQAAVQFTLQGWQAATWQPYLNEALAVPLRGTLGANGSLHWQAAAEQRVVIDSLRIEKAELQSRSDPLRLAALQADKLDVDLAKRAVTIERVALDQPTVAIQRNRDGQWSWQRWLRTAAPAHAATAEAKAPAWSVRLNRLELAQGTIGYDDFAPNARPDATPVSLRATRVQLQASQLGSALDNAVPFTLSAALADRRARDAKPGSLRIDGRYEPKSQGLRGRLALTQLPVAAFEPYAQDYLNFRLLQAALGFKGQLQWQSQPAWSVRLDGDTLVSDLHTQDSIAQDDLLTWDSLALRGLRVQAASASPAQVEIGEVLLSGFYSRLIVTPDGRLNLSGLFGKPADAANAATPASSAPAPSPVPTPSAPLAAAPAAAASAAAPADAGRPVIRVGKVTLANGRVAFSDRFVRPNYSADITQLSGTVSGFASDDPQTADVELNGRAEGTALLTVTGKLNPVANPILLDLTGRLRELELAPLSPYSGKYAGYRIEKGKLSFDVHYQVENNRLKADNKLVLNQLTFGEKVDSPDATKLPVLFIVSLLKDRNGVIDVNLPISGTINDPQFSLGGVILRVIVNLLTKAVTAPFALLTSAFGGGDEQSFVAFDSGRSELDAKAREQLERIGKALADRPALKLTLGGLAAPAAEAAGLRQAKLEQALVAEKRRQLVRDGVEVTPQLLGITAQERDGLLREVYRRADIKKPRNLIGIAKDLPPAEMQRLLIEQMPLGDDDFRALALARAVAVRDFLLGRGLESARLFMGEPKLNRAPEAGWSPRVELSLQH